MEDASPSVGVGVRPLAGVDCVREYSRGYSGGPLGDCGTGMRRSQSDLEPEATQSRNHESSAL